MDNNTSIQSSPVAADGDIYVLDSPYEVANWRPLVHWLMYIPHGLVGYTLNVLSQVVLLLNWFHLLFTGRLNSGLWAAQAGCLRYEARADAFLFGYSEKYAPFDFNFSVDDNGAYSPLRFNLPDVPERTPRRALFNFLLAIPHYIVIVVIGIGALVVVILAWFAVLFTGRWPKGMRNFLVAFANYLYRVGVYVSMVTTHYPSFGL